MRAQLSLVALALCSAGAALCAADQREYSTGYTLVDTGVVLEEKERYAPAWESLDRRPLPRWYDAAKLGVFLHWGVYSVPSFGSEWFWSNWHGNNSNYVDFMNRNYRPGFTYQQFAPMFTANLFEPDKWAQLFQKAGFKYVVLTSKHHDGYTLFPSKRSFSWNAVDVGPKRDLVGELASAVRAKNLKFGLYHSLYEWFNPIYMEDKEALFKTRKYPETKLWPDIKQLIRDYEPSVIWSDGDWEALDTYWNSTDLLAWLYNDSPVRNEVVVNDRWGVGTPCKHGDFYNCADRYNPGTTYNPMCLFAGVLQNHKWENAFTIDKKSWGYRMEADLSDIMTIQELLKEIVTTVSCGGNALVNVGPTKEGTIAPIFQERLLQLGAWLKINGEAIYESAPWIHQNDTNNPEDVWYTCSKAAYNGHTPTARPTKADNVTVLYAIVLKWPKNNLLILKDVTKHLKYGQTKVELLGNSGQYLDWKTENASSTIAFPDLSTVKSEHAWTLKFTAV